MSSTIVAVSPTARQRTVPSVAAQQRRRTRAATIAAVGRVAVVEEGSAYRVASQTRRGAEYDVIRGAEAWECSCEDHDGQLAGGCKHARAIDLLDRAIAVARVAEAEAILDTAEAEILPAIAEDVGSLDHAEAIARRAVRWVTAHPVPQEEEAPAPDPEPAPDPASALAERVAAVVAEAVRRGLLARLHDRMIKEACAGVPEEHLATFDLLLAAVLAALEAES